MAGLYGMGTPMPKSTPMIPSGGAGPYNATGNPPVGAMTAPLRPTPPTMGPTPIYNQAPVASAPAGVGNNGFGIHPDVGHHDIVDYLLPKFKSVESQSSGGYTAQHANYPKYTASGAYGYTDGTWNHYQGYPRAKDAPPEVQDQRMREDLLSQLQRFQGDPFKTVANHYWPAFAHDPTKWDAPLKDKYGKPIVNENGKPADTVRQYLSGVLPPERVEKYMAGIGATQ